MTYIIAITIIIAIIILLIGVLWAPVYFSRETPVTAKFITGTPMMCSAQKILEYNGLLQAEHQATSASALLRGMDTAA